ncbi:MAG: hypothetical protein MJA83_11710 [Gammaproteobacteria bacterium]|nr:hypothetical protein [Gammaproteobacteria bacterium]
MSQASQTLAVWADEVERRARVHRQKEADGESATSKMLHGAQASALERLARDMRKELG